MNEVLDFCEKYGVTENQFYGREKIGGNLDLSSVETLIEGFNPTVGEDLYLPGVKTLPVGFSPTVGGDLYLRSVKTLPAGFNPTVGGDLYLQSVKTLPVGFSPTVSGDLNLRNVKTLPVGFNPTVGGYLNLRNVKTLPVGFNPTVGGYLDLSSVEAIIEGFNPTVGGGLDLSGVKTLPAGFNPTVGGDLYFNGEWHTRNDTVNLSWQDGKYEKLDGIFCEVLHKKQIKNTIIRKCKPLAKDAIFYVVTKDGVHSHGETIQKAKDDLKYKVSRRDTSMYKNFTLDSVVTFDKGIALYRIITGACEGGTKMFVEELKKPKKKYTVKEIIELTKGKHGNNELIKFFS